MIRVIALAVAAAAMYAMSDFLEQRAASRAAHSSDRGLREDGSRWKRAWLSAEHTLRRLVTSKQWALGWLVGTLAYFVQAAALHLGSVSVVQSLQVTTLLFALGLSAIGSSLRPHALDWVGAASICTALTLLLVVREHAPHTGVAHRGRILFLLLMIVAAVVLLVAAAVVHTGPVRATLLAIAAGASFAMSATLVKLTSDDLTNFGVAHTARDWPGYTLALATGVGLVLQQLAFASGRLPTAITAMTVANPVIGSVIAVIGFAEPLPSSVGLLTGLALAGALLVVGVTLLAHSPLLRADDDQLADTGSSPPSESRRAELVGEG